MRAIALHLLAIALDSLAIALDRLANALDLLAIALHSQDRLCEPGGVVHQSARLDPGGLALRGYGVFDDATGGHIRTLILIAALAAIPYGMQAEAQSGPADPRLGTWTLLSAQSSLDPPNRLTITPTHDGMHVVMSGETHLDFTANTNGHKSSAPGNLGFDQIELHRINKHQAAVKEEKDGAVVATVNEKLSKDGNELTSTTTMAQKADKFTVWTRGAGKKSASDPFAGEWTEDLGKSRMRQGGELKIEADGRGGTRFTWDYSYTARFDGKQYDLKDSRNDTVALQLTDSHTVDAVYRRGDQVTERDKWQVSADGHQMTVSISGTLETGQKVTEKLTFKK